MLIHFILLFLFNELKVNDLNSIIKKRSFTCNFCKPHSIPAL